MAIFAFHGLQGGMMDWEGIPVYPAGQQPYGGDVAGMHARHFGADLVITLMDHWALAHETLVGLKTAAWMPIDCDPLSSLDFNRLTAGHEVWPVPLSRFGERVLREAGWDIPANPSKTKKPAPLYVPHGIDTQATWIPPEDRDALRDAMGVSGKFVVFMDAANMDKQRKGYIEQIAAFSRFHARHPDTMLVIHAVEESPNGLKLPEVVARMGCADAVKFNSQYLITAGMIEPEQLRGSYGMADLYSGCSLAEGFGLGPLQAMACGVPTAVTNGSTMPEVQGGGGWLVKGEKAWASGHNSWWQRPLIDDIVRVYEKAYRRDGPYQAKKAAARQSAVRYDVGTVMKDHWVPALAKLEEWACG